MSARLSLAIALAAVLALVAIGNGPSDAADEKEKDPTSGKSRYSIEHAKLGPTLQPFKHPVIVATTGEGGDMFVIQDARVANLGDRSFLTGSYLGGARVPAIKGTTVWVPVQKIEQLVEFESLEKVSEIIRIE